MQEARDLREEGGSLAALWKPDSLRDYARQRYATLDGSALLERWRRCLHSLSEALSTADAKTRLTWLGPNMDVRMFTTARYMETWAHAQDTYHLLGRERVYTDSIRAVATLGVRTYGFCFGNRRLKPPAPE